jgi:N-acetylneuraminic acid mutarotase
VLHLPVGVSRAVAVMMSGRIVVLGGLAPGDSSTSRIWSVDLAGRRVTRAGSLSLAVHDASGAVLHGAAFVFGGGSATTVATVQEWDGRRTRVVGSLPAPRSDSAAAVIGGVAYIVGGFDGSRLVREVLATTDGRHFRTVARLRVGVRYPAVVADGRDLLVAGGALATTEGTAAGPVTAAVQQVDVATGIVSVVGRLDRPMAHGVGCVVGGRPLVVGGRSGGRPLDAIVEPRSRRRAGTLPVALSDGACASAGSVGYVVGGESSGPGAPLRSVIALTAR